MGTTQDESALQELAGRVAKMEQANADLHEILANLQAGQLTAPPQVTPFAPGPASPGIFGSQSADTPAIEASGINGADGIDAFSDSGTGIFVRSGSGIGIHAVGGGTSPSPKPIPDTREFAILAESDGNCIVATSNRGVSIWATGGGDGAGVLGIGNSTPKSIATGVAGESDSGAGVFGSSSSGTGVFAASNDGYGIDSSGGNIGVYAHNLTAKGNAVYLGTTGLAGDFYGEVFFHNKITKQGGGFQIDHPLDPAKKYLSHSFVESPDMKNIYDGIAVLDAQGEAEVELPDWFEALNTDFRYQLTCIGSYTPVYIAQEIHDHRFTITGGKAGMKISWQVTGTRQDAWANAHRVQVEIDKPIEEQGHYLAPELHGESAEKSIRWARYPRQKEPRWPRIRAGEGSDVLPSHERRSSPLQAEPGDS